MKTVRTLVTGAYWAMMAMILFLLIVVIENYDFLLKRRYAISYAQILGIGIVLLLLILIPAYLLHGCKRKVVIGKPAAWGMELAGWGVILGLQMAYCYFAYFLTSWDASAIVHNAFYLAKYGVPEYLDSLYFSHYPNNVLIVEIFAMIIRLFCLVAGDPGLERCVLILLFVQCVINTGTGFFLRRIALKLTGSSAFALATAVAYVIFIGFSPWLLISYTDSMALFVPTLCLYLYYQQRGSKYKMIHWVTIGAVSAVGYLLKPQAVIMTIAILLWETLRWIVSKEAYAWCMSVGCAFLVLMICVGPVNDMIQENSLIEVDKSQSVGMMHYFMMGMHPETRGTYNDEDVYNTFHMPPEERTSIQLKEGVRRIREMGTDGFFKLMKDKLLISYSDGMFAWGIYASFFREKIEDKDTLISPLLKNIVYTDGKYYTTYRLLRQCLWEALLMGCLLLPFACVMNKGKAERDILTVMMIAIMGLTVFECIFEVLSRYLYTYAPIYLLMGMLGLWYTLMWIKVRVKKWINCPILRSADE